jgi:MFS family permease
MLPLLPFYAEHFGATPFVATTLLATYAAAQLVAGPILGKVSDRVGRKPVLLVSQMGSFFAFLILGSANGLAMLFVGRLIDGLTAGNLSIAQAYISDVTKPEDRTRSFALIGIAFGSGFLIGPMLSGEMVHRVAMFAPEHQYGAPAFMAAGLSLLALILTATLLPGQEALDRIKRRTHAGAADAPAAVVRRFAFGRLLREPLPRKRLLQFFAFVVSFALLNGGLALFLERQFGFGSRQTGWVYGLSGLVGGIIQGGAMKRLVGRFGEARLALLGFGAMAVAYPLLGVTRAVPVLVVLVVLSGFGVAVVRPCLTTLITKSVSRAEQGEALGTSQSLASIAQIVGPETSGLLIQHGLLVAYGVVAGLVATVGFVLSWTSASPADKPSPDGAQLPA